MVLHQEKSHKLQIAELKNVEAIVIANMGYIAELNAAQVVAQERQKTLARQRLIVVLPGRVVIGVDLGKAGGLEEGVDPVVGVSVGGDIAVGEEGVAWAAGCGWG